MSKRTVAVIVETSMFVLVVAACGGGDSTESDWICDDPTCTPGPDGDSGNVSDVDAGLDPGDAGDGRVDSGRDDVDGDGGDPTDVDGGDGETGDDRPVRRGSIRITQDRTESIQRRPGISVYGAFRVIEPSERSETPCRTEEAGHCRLEVCETGRPIWAEGERVSGGEVTIADGEREVGILPDEQNEYQYGDEQLLWESPTTLTVTAAGERVEAFSTQVDTSRGVTVETPEFAEAFESMRVETSSDFPVDWRARDFSDTELLVEFTALTRDDERIVLNCGWPIRRESGSIPEELLSRIPPDTNANYEFGVGTERQIEAGDFEVTVRAIDLAEDGDPETWSGKGSARFVE